VVDHDKRRTAEQLASHVRTTAVRVGYGIPECCVFHENVLEQHVCAVLDTNATVGVNGVSTPDAVAVMIPV
jgi:hypothetical protein